MESEFVQPFVVGVKQMLSSMTGIACEEANAELPLPTPYVSGVITMSGSARGQVALTFSRETACLIVAEMLGLELAELDQDMLQDGIGEMTNIVAGHAKAQLVGTRYHFNLSLPSIVVGPDHHIDLFKVQRVALRRFESDFGAFSMHVWLLPDSKDELRGAL